MAPDIEAEAAELAAAAEARPIATAVLVQVLRMSLVLPFEDALVAESLAYSTLLGGAEFAAWRAATPVRLRPPSEDGAPDAPWVRLARGESGLMVTLARADARNAVNARLRDELVDALEFALVDPEAGPVVLTGEGPAFSAGGDLNEFGQATDLALAHAVRVRQSPARLVRRLGGRLTARLHGPCIGAGIEIPAGGGPYRGRAGGLVPSAGSVDGADPRGRRHSDHPAPHRARAMRLHGAQRPRYRRRHRACVGTGRRRGGSAMSGLSAAVRRLAEQIAVGSAAIGTRVEVGEEVLDARARWMTLAPPGERSPNGSCRMVRAADGWIAVNLPREDDLASVPAWIGCRIDDEPWAAIERAARAQTATVLVEDAQRLGLPVAGVGAVRAADADAPWLRFAAGGRRTGLPRPRVVDLSSLWAGPLCGALLARAGCEVRKIESVGRPDVARLSTPGFFAELNSGKAQIALDFADPDDLGRLRQEIAQADVLITSARPRAFDQLGLSPQAVFAENPGLVWTAITGYGWAGPLSHQVAFGDDAAAAGGLVRWREGRPQFMGDALADPLTGLAAAAGTLKALAQGGGVLVDVAMARTAAGVAAQAALVAAV